MNRTRPYEAGYSLAEMLTVIAIIGALAVVTVPAFMTFYQSNKMKSSMRNFTTDLRSVRQLAISQGKEAMLSYGIGTTARTYNWYLGDKPYNSVNWTAKTGPGTNRPTKVLENTVYFPAIDPLTTPPTLQTFTNSVTCPPPACAPGNAEIVFRPDGSARASGTITLKTDMRIPKPQYAITISPSGQVHSQ